MIRVFRYTRVCAVHTQFLLFRRPLPNRLPRRRRTAAVCRSRFRLWHFPAGRPARPQRSPYPPLLRRQRTAAQHLRRQRPTLPTRILLHPSARQRSRLRPGRRTGRLRFRRRTFLRQPPYFRHLIVFRQHDIFEELIKREANSVTIPIRGRGVIIIMKAQLEGLRKTNQFFDL